MSEAVLGPKSAKYRVFCGYTWKTPVYLENTWVSCRFPQFCPRFCPRPALRLRETREFPEGNSRETEWSTKHPLVSLETSGNAKCWGPSGFPLGCRKPRKGQEPSDAENGGISNIYFTEVCGVVSTWSWSTWSAVISLTSRAGELRSAPSGPDDRDRVAGKRALAPGVRVRRERAVK